MKSSRWVFITMMLFFVVLPADATPGITALTVKNSASGETSYSITLQVLFLMTALTILPALLMGMTAFVRIVIVLSVLRQAMGMASTPTNQILIIISLFLTLFIMMPVFNNVNQVAVQPYLEDKISVQQAASRAQLPFRSFMLKQTRANDLKLFSEISGNGKVASIDDLPILVIMPAFMTSELKTAFQMGFVIFLPFLVVDLVISSVLMAMGMMMLSPLIISLPFKILLFVMVDGWSLILGTLAGSFGI